VETTGRSFSLVAYHYHYLQYVRLDMEENEEMAFLVGDGYYFFLVGTGVKIRTWVLFSHRLALGYKTKAW